MTTIMKDKKHLNFLLVLLAFLFNPQLLFSQINSFPYSQNFDVSNGGWTTTTINGTAWELGTPTAAGTIGSYSTPNCFGTDLDSGYRASSFSYLISPKFYVSSLSIPYFSFYQFRYMSGGLDGMHLEYTLNDTSWNQLGTFNSPSASNWYNVNNLFSTGLPAFTSNSITWVQSGINLASLGTLDSIRIRFVFRSNNNFGSAQPGIFIDDVRMEQMPAPAIDVAITSISSPASTVNATTIYPISITIQNNSSVFVDTVFCNYSINGSNSSILPIYTGLGPFQTGTFTIDSSTFPAGSNSLCGFVSVPNDINSMNDLFCKSVFSNTPLSLPYFEDFENGNGGWYQTSVDSLTRWEYGTPSFGATSGAYSGTNCWDVNLFTSYAPNANATLYTPQFNISGPSTGRMSFWINYSSENFWDGTRVEYSVDNDITWNLLGIVNDPNATEWYNYNNLNSSSLPGWAGNSGGWKKSIYNLFNLVGQNAVRFRFVFSSDVSIQYEGISIDNFKLEWLPDYDIELTSISILSPAYAIGSTTDPINLTVKNIGGLTITNFNYEYFVNGVPQFNANNFGNLLPGASIQLSLPGFFATQVNSLVCGKINLANDADTSNNFACTNVIGLPIYTPTWIDNFDSGNMGWYNENVSGAATNWELGLPTFGITSGTLSGPNAWDVNLNTAYTNSAHCRLYTPYFDLSTAIHPKFEFWQNRNSENLWDGMRVEYKSNNDPTWKVMGELNDIFAQNWYNDSSLNSSNLPGWTGNSSGWIQSIYNLDVLLIGNIVQFRFVFTADATGFTDGISIDNFKISTIYAQDAMLSTFVNPGPNVIQGASTPVDVVLKNNGSLNLTNLNIKYSFNGNTPVNYLWNGNLPNDSSMIVSLPSILPIAGINTLTVYIDWPSDLYNGNDTISTTFFCIVTAGLPYYIDFENGSGGWQANAGSGGTNWELGQPAFAPLNSTHSGNACWDINLTSPYFNLANAILTSPFLDISPYNIITIQFWMNYSSESNADGMYLEYTTNGSTWQRLGNIGDPNGINWYNSSLTSGKIGWSGVSGGWQSASYIYTSPLGNSFLQFRYYFISDFNIVNAGFSVDDISITGVTSVNEINSSTNIFVYPNPANDEINIFWKVGNINMKRIEMLSVDGKSVYQSILSNNSNHKINTSLYLPGLYLLILENENGAKWFKRIVVQH